MTRTLSLQASDSNPISLRMSASCSFIAPLTCIRMLCFVWPMFKKRCWSNSCLYAICCLRFSSSLTFLCRSESRTSMILVIWLSTKRNFSWVSCSERWKLSSCDSTYRSYCSNWLYLAMVVESRSSLMALWSLLHLECTLICAVDRAVFCYLEGEYFFGGE